jgi:hypothetical protein
MVVSQFDRPLSPKTLRQIYNDRHSKKGMTIHQLSWKHNLSRYVCGYALKAYRLILEAMEAAGKAAIAFWNKTERRTMDWADQQRKNLAAYVRDRNTDWAALGIETYIG